jgi:DUF971 family protein
MQPLRIKQHKPKELEVQWSDGHESIMTLKTLRDACPCAGCKGETILMHTYSPDSPELSTPGRYELKRASLVGGYAIKLTWGDGHDMGLYTWEHLRSLCECSACVALKQKQTTG